MPQVIPYLAQLWQGISAWFSTYAAQAYWTTVKLLVVAGSISYSASQQRKAARNALNKGRTFMFREADAPRQIIYGEVKTSGPIVFIDATGTNNEYLHIIVALASHSCEGIGTVYLNDDALTLDGSGNATGSPYAGFVTVSKYLGDASQTVALAGSTSPRWTSNHRLRGITCLAVRLKWSAEVFPNGIPNISAIVTGKNDIVDYRDSSTGYTNNWALCLADYLTSPLGLGDNTSRLSLPPLQAAANDSDEAVELEDESTEPRYTMNGVVITDAAPGDVIETMVNNAAGFCGFIGGKWVIHAGTYRTPTQTIDESCLRGPIKVQTKASRAETFNGIKGVFTSPDNNWQPADFPPVTNSTYTTQDQEVRIWRDVEYAFITSNATAQRVSKIALERVRQEITVELRCNMKVASVQAGDNVMLTLTRPGWSSKVFEVVSCTFVPEEQDGAMALGYDLVLRETASGVWDWNNGEETTIDLAPNTNLPDPRTTAAPTSLTLTSDATTTDQQPDGTTIPRILVGWTAPTDEFVQSGGDVRVEYKASAAGTWNHADTVRGLQTQAFITDILIGTAYDVRIRSENTLGGVSEWVEDSVTAAGDTVGPDAPTGLVATSGAGFISLDWDDSDEPDLSEYGVYRHTSDSFGSATKIAEARTSRFVDANVTAGVTYYYWITAFDRSENESGESTGATAAPSAAISGATPSTPDAPTFNSEGTYSAGDGAIFAYIVVNTPALPSGAVANDILYRVDGSGSWIIADQQYGSGTARVDDLSPGVAYEFAVRSLSNGGAPSSVSSTLSRTTPNKSTGPATPSSVSATVVTGGVLIDWADNTESDLSEYVVYRHTSDSFGGASQIATIRASSYTDHSGTYGVTYYWWIKARNRSGVLSAESLRVSAIPSRIGSSDLDDDAVTTPKIASGAVSEVDAIIESDSVAITNNSYAVVATLSVTTATGNDVVIAFSFGYADDGPAETTDFDVRLRRDGTTSIYDADQTARAGNTELVAGNTVDQDLASAVSTYTLEVRPRGGGGTATPTIRDPFISALILRDR